jgi:hypothetical protein
LLNRSLSSLKTRIQGLFDKYYKPENLQKPICDKPNLNLDFLNPRFTPIITKSRNDQFGEMNTLPFNAFNSFSTPYKSNAKYNTRRKNRSNSRGSNNSKSKYFTDFTLSLS